jgi:aryl sulfotransferase
MQISQRRVYNDGVTDSKRWDTFKHRPGDVVIATPAKCGTTWTQAIVASLLWPDGSPPEPVVIVSPWVDGRIEPAESVAERLERQQHRRFVKTHTPADGVPWWPTASYIVVLRDGRDAFMSLLNHMAKMRPEIVALMNAEAEMGGGQPLHWSGDPHQDFPQWLASDQSAPAYLASWWPRRREPNVLLLHYNDLKADLAGEMRRIASFLGLTVPEGLWPSVVERCTFESMRARGDEIGPFELVFEGGAGSFLFKGTNGRWRDVLTEEELAQYQRRVAELLSPEAADWMEHGSLASGRRPNTRSGCV